ncbi:hypothetical protein MACH23_32360 [Sulfitobacter pontiacus]|nr:hypothetical protein MACH23_32360 [Sulfitobacter pontiacus]
MHDKVNIRQLAVREDEINWEQIRENEVRHTYMFFDKSVESHGRDFAPDFARQ